VLACNVRLAQCVLFLQDLQEVRDWNVDFLFQEQGVQPLLGEAA